MKKCQKVLAVLIVIGAVTGVGRWIFHKKSGSPLIDKEKRV